MSSRDEGIFGKQYVLLYVAEAVLKHTMSHDHSHFSSLFPLFLRATGTPTTLGGGSSFYLGVSNVEEIPFFF
jgi:hypothetical protein